MSEADKLFEELGYEKKEEIITGSMHNIKYYKDDDNVIYFGKDDAGKAVRKDGKYSEYCDDITMQELKAINKKCLELRMDRGVINNEDLEMVIR